MSCKDTLHLLTHGRIIGKWLIFNITKHSKKSIIRHTLSPLFCGPGNAKPHWSVPYYYRIRLYWLLLWQLHRPANWVFRRSIAIPITLLSTLKPNVTASAPRLANGGVVSSLPDEVSTHYFRLPRWTNCLAPLFRTINIIISMLIIMPYAVYIFTTLFDKQTIPIGTPLSNEHQQPWQFR